MPLPIIRVEGTVSKFIRENLPADLYGLLALAEEAASMFRERVHVKGLAGDGRPWSPYVEKRKGRPGDRFYWAKATDPAPEAGRIVRAGPGAGRYANRSAYASVAAWRRAVGHPRTNPKRYVMTGELRDSIKAHQARPTVATVSYSNRRRKGPFYRARSGKAFTNQKVAQFAFRAERMSPMQPSADEIERLTNLAAVALPARVLTKLQEAESLRQGQGRVRRAKRLLEGARQLVNGGVPIR